MPRWTEKRQDVDELLDEGYDFDVSCLYDALWEEGCHLNPERVKAVLARLARSHNKVLAEREYADDY